MKTPKTLGIHEKETIAAMLAHIASECDKVDTESMYDEMLDDCYSFEKVGGIFACMQPSRVLSECDPVAYRCGLNDYLDSCRDSLIEIDGEYYQSSEVDDARESFVKELNEQVEELEIEVAELELADDQCGLEKLNDEIERLKSCIEACEEHSF